MIDVEAVTRELTRRLNPMLPNGITIGRTAGAIGVLHDGDWTHGIDVVAAFGDASGDAIAVGLATVLRELQAEVARHVDVPWPSFARSNPDVPVATATYNATSDVVELAYLGGPGDMHLPPIAIAAITGH